MKVPSVSIGILTALLLSMSLPAQQGRAAPPPLDVTYIANAGFLIRAAGKKVLIDAPIVGADVAPPPETLDAITLARAPFDNVDLILITHRHSDHFDPASLIACLRSNPKAQLVAHAQAVDLMRSIGGFASIESRIHEIKLEPGARERVSRNGITVDVLCLNHMHSLQVRNLAFAVELGGVRFLHMGDSLIDESEAHLNGYPFEQAPIDILFVNRIDRSEATLHFIAEKIKPSQIVAMHVSPEELAEESKEPTIRAAYPRAVVFKQSMERRVLPIEVDFHNLTGEYFGLTPPGATPQVFARGIVSTDDIEHSAPAFSAAGNEVFWFVNRPPGPDNEKWWSWDMTMRRVGDKWTAPAVSAYRGVPFLSNDGRRLYFDFSGPSPDGKPEGPYFVERQGNRWTEQKSIGLVARFPELRFAYVPSFTRNGTVYFSGFAVEPKLNSGIYRAELVNGEYAKPELLPRNINLPPFLNGTPFIAPDESFLLFSSNRRDPDHDDGDLYISRRLADGSWTDPVSLGEPVNSDMQERFPMVSPDGKYLFFTLWVRNNDHDVYWVDAATILALRPITTLSPEKQK